MKILTQLRLYMVFSIISFTGLSFIYINSLDELKKTKEELIKYETDSGYIPGGNITAEHISDSLRNEVFIKDVQIGRYEIALELFKEKNNNAFQEFELILTTQTE